MNKCGLSIWDIGIWVGPCCWCLGVSFEIAVSAWRQYGPYPAEVTKEGLIVGHLNAAPAVEQSALWQAICDLWVAIDRIMLCWVAVASVNLRPEGEPCLLE
jgi:hypothetical protein